MDRYVSALASSGAGTEADPWTLAQAVTAINDSTVANGETVWVKADGTYTTAGIIITASGALDGGKRLAGYTTAIGDGGQATIQRSGGSVDLIKFTGLYWTFENFILDGQDSGTNNLYQNYGPVINVESHSGGTRGILNGGMTVNCYCHDNATQGFQGCRVCINCIGVNGAYPFYTCDCISCIGKGASTANFYTVINGIINCISDGGTGDGFEIYNGSTLMNSIAINSPSGKYGVNIIGASSFQASYVANVDFYNNDDDTNDIDQVHTYYELDPQFRDADSLDYTRSGRNLDDLGFSEIGMQTPDYKIDIGPDQRITQPDPSRYAVRIRDNRRTVAIRDRRIAVVRED